MDAVDRRCFGGGGKPEHLRVGSFSKVSDCGKAVNRRQVFHVKDTPLARSLRFFFPSVLPICDMKIAIVGKLDIATLMASWSACNAKASRTIALALAWAAEIHVSIGWRTAEVQRVGGWKQTREKDSGGNDATSRGWFRKVTLIVSGHWCIPSK
jgi:hypothetical protein